MPEINHTHRQNRARGNRRRAGLLAAATAFSTLLPRPTAAVIYYWQGPSTGYQNFYDANWSQSQGAGPYVTPTANAGSQLIINNGGYAWYIAPVNGFVYVGGPSNNIVSVEVDTNTLTVNESYTSYSAGAGILVDQGGDLVASGTGTINTDGPLSVGQLSGNTGYASFLSNSISNIGRGPNADETLYDGNGGNGNITQANNAVVNIGNLLVLGSASTGSGIYNLMGGALSANQLDIAESSGSTGSVIMSGGSINLTQTAGTNQLLRVGVAGTGIFQQTAGSVTTNSLWIGNSNTSNGTYTLNGSSASVTITSGGTLSLGYGTGSVGTFNIVNGTFNDQSGASIGLSGTGTLNQTGGTGSFGSNVNIAQNTGSTGTFNLSGGSSTVSGAVYVGGSISGAGGTAALNLTAGTLNTSGGVNVQTGGTLNWTGGSLLGPLSLTGGTINTPTYPAHPGGFNWSGGGTLNLNGSTGLTIGTGGPIANLTLASGMTLTTSGTLAVASGGTLNLSGGTINTPTLTNSGQFNWNTSGTLNISGANGLTIGTGGPISNLTLTSGMALTTSEPLMIASGGNLNVASGSLGSNSIVQNGGILTIPFSASTNSFPSNSITLDGSQLFPVVQVGYGATNSTVERSNAFFYNYTFTGGTLNLAAYFVDVPAQDLLNGQRLNVANVDLGAVTVAGGSQIIATGNLFVGCEFLYYANNYVFAPWFGGSTVTLGRMGYFDNGSAIRVSGDVSIGSFLTPSGSITVNLGTTLAVGQSIYDGGYGQSFLNLAGGTIQAAALNIDGGSTFNWSSGTLDITGAGSGFGGTVTVPGGGAFNLAGSISDPVVISSGGSFSVMAGGSTSAAVTVGAGGAFNLSAGGAISALLTANTNAAVNLYGVTSGPLTVGPGAVVNIGSNNSSGIYQRSMGTITIAANTGNTANGQINVLAASNHSNRQLVIAAGLSIVGSTNAWQGLLDLSNNDMDVQSANMSAGQLSLATVTNQIKQGYNGGHWNGTGGIISTSAASDSRHLTTLGVILNGSTYGYAPGSLGLFDGYDPAINDVLVKYTYYGDTNLDGKVDGSDYSRIDAAYLADRSNSTAMTGWYNGDFNYDGLVDGSDYTLIDNAFNTQGSQLTSELATATAQIAGTTAVPEPTLSLLTLAAAGLLGRKRRSLA